MKLDLFNPAKKLKASYQRLHIDREKIELFKENIKQAFQDIAIADKKKESEEHYKAIVRDFLLDTYYKGNHSINTQGRNDLVIHNGSNATSPVGIIIETKQPSNKSEMISAKNPNSKSFQQLITYFLKERFENKNLEIKHLIISNIYEWYIFDASDFERYFYDNKKIKDSYLDWTNKTSLMSKTDWFYKEVLFPHIEKNLEFIPCTYFNLKDYESIINNDNLEDDEALLDLYKILSPEHLLKKQITNDGNSLNKQFYAELLHILGLEEIKEGSKKTIKRCAKPLEGSILENTLAKLKTKARDLSETEIYDTALELTITWLNRILFLKLLEGQLIKYNNNPDFAFLNYKKIDEYDILEELFFEVLAVNYKDRPDSIQKLYANIPYLNSSLFEETELERKYFGIGLLKDRLDIPIYSNTVLNFQVKGSSKRTLEYLFEFLDAYDFGDESKGKIKENSKSIINASVLGLIFEKINGYKDGSFFTPSFITMYMCRESIRRAVVQKFNDTYGWKCEEFTDLKNEIKSIKKKEASDTLNTLRICDPAVGSGHFLVSALNELITIKQDLKILIDSEGVDMSEYNIDIENDELVIKDVKGIPYSYQFQNKESRRIQETLFREKQTIIENCLFGVDINPKSVMICRLRLWIELLKNAYYTESSKYKELETLPNIDINIKCGNSLISRFEVKYGVFDNKENIKNKLKDYKFWVDEYKNIKDKNVKGTLKKNIESFKNEFNLIDPRLFKIEKEITKITEEIIFKYKNPNLFSNSLTKKELDEKNSLELKLENITKQRLEVLSNTLYENAFEWRFEFPEIIDDDGKFIGFDVIIGNPPYGVSLKDEERITINKMYGKVPDFEIYYYFINLSKYILKEKGVQSFIIPNTILFNVFAKKYRLELLDNWKITELLDCTNFEIFEEATVRNVITFFENYHSKNKISYKPTKDIDDFENLINQKSLEISKEELSIQNNNWGLAFKLDKNISNLILKIKSNSKLSEQYNYTQGYIPYRKSDLIKEYGETKANNIVKNREWHSEKKINEEYLKEIWGSNFSKYNYSDSGSYIWYGKHLATYVDLKYFNQKRLLVREITSPSIIGCVVEELLVNDPQLISIIPLNETYTIEFIWAILNSKLATFYHFNSSPKATKGAFPKILIEDIKNFPLPKIEPKGIMQLEKQVDKILSLKKSNPETDTSDLEAEIDKMVYELYGLSEEEIKVVENK